MNPISSRKCVAFRAELWKIAAQVNGKLADPESGFIKIRPDLTTEEHFNECPTPKECREFKENILMFFWGHLMALLREFIRVPMIGLDVPSEAVAEMLLAWPEKPATRMDLKQFKWEHLNELVNKFIEIQRMEYEDGKKLARELGKDLENNPL